MVANSQAFDIGPLSWVKTEIEHSLSEGRVNLDKLAADPGDTKAQKYISTHLHQVTGALSMVGLGAATRFNEEIEALVATFAEPGAKAQITEHIGVVKEATSVLSSYLDSLMHGDADRPMMLASSYLAVNRARGQTDASESDLFSPDLTVVVPMPDDTVALPKTTMLVEAIKQRRGLYQEGLIKLLREKNLEAGARDMRNATLAIEALQVTSPSRAFWYTASGFFDAVADDAGAAAALSVQLFGKIDQQIKLLIDGVQKVPERLFRDLLLVIGKSSSTTERVKKIRALYRLDELLAAAPERDHTSDEALKATVRALRDQVQAIKEYWLKFTSGNRAALEQFSQQGDALSKQAQAQPNTALAELLRVVGLIGPHLKKTGLPANETQAIEIATALLFIESSLDNHSRLGNEFSQQAQAVVVRIKGAMSGVALPVVDPSTNALMDDMSKRAQERLLVFQVGQEIQINLATIENTLDQFFRDPVKTAELSALPPLFSQVQGALMILELDEAAALNQMLRDRVTQFSSGAVKGAGEDAESVAEGVSALGLYVTALQQGAAHPRDVLLPALIRFGLAAKPVDVEKSMIKAPVSAADVEVDKQRVQALYADWKQQPEATTTRDQLREAVIELKQNAELAGDSASAKQGEATLKAIEQTFDPMKSGITEALADMAPTKPAEAPTAQVVQLIDATSHEVDKELLDIFLEEATEVVATIREHLAVLRDAASDKEALTTIRRGFHTLKGSGRMVGLIDLGEVAWNCEQVMNKWLKEDKSASAGLLAFIERASADFSAWVNTLQTEGTTQIDGTEITRICEQLKNDKEPDFSRAPVEVKHQPEVPLSSPSGFDLQPLHAVEPETVPPVLFVPEASESLALQAHDEPMLSEVAAPPAETVTAHETSPSVDVPVVDDLSVHEPYLSSALHSSLEPHLSLTPPPLPEMPSESAVFAELPALSMPPATPVEEVHALVSHETPAEPDIEPAAEEQEEQVQVGHVHLAAPLFEIYLGESGSHVEMLDNQMAALEANPMSPITHEFMRAAHTLTSSSRTTGFESIADVAFALEKWLQDAIELVPEFDGHRLQTTRQAIDTLANMILSLYTYEYPTPAPDIVAELIALREHLKTGAKSGSGTHLKMPTMFDLSEPEASHLVDTAPVPSEGIIGFETTPVPDLTLHAEEARTDDLEFVPDVISHEPPPIPTHHEEVVFTEHARLYTNEHLDEPAHEITPDTPAEQVAVPDTVNDTATDVEPVAEPHVPPHTETPAFDPAMVFGVAAASGLAAATAAFTHHEPQETTPPPVEHAAPVVEPPPVPPPVVETPALPPEPPPPIVLSPPEPVAPVNSQQPASVPAFAEPANVEPVFESGRDRRTVKDDVDLDLLPIFIEEAREIMPQLGDALRRWRTAPGNHAPVAELARHLHTLKGSARMAGLMRLGELAHVMETRIIDMDRVAEPNAAMFDPVDDRLDRFNGAIESLAKGDLSPIIDIPVEAAVAADVPAELPTPMAAMVAARAEIIAEGEKLEGRDRQALLRVNADLIDRFVNEAGELAIARSRVDLEIQTFKKSLLDLSDNVGRMKVQLREIEIGAESQIQSRLKEAETLGEQFDPLEFDRFSRMQELTRFLAESLNDVVTLQQSLQKNIDEADAALLQQGRLNRDLQQGLMGVRLVPLGNLQDRFYRLVRQTAKELDKKANLEFRGVRVEIDRSVLEKITAPFEHLLRNAVAHGLELPIERAAKGKSEIGEITIDARQSGNEVMLTISDDGAGLNFVRIREKAIQKGLLDANAEVNDIQLTQFIFAPGFSTADNITQISGRGVGMDVVRSEIVSLGGRIDITSVDGRGTTFIIALPLTLAVTQAVMVTVGESTYAIPSVMIEQVQEYKGKRYEPMLDLKEIEWKGNKYPLRSMEAMLGGQPKVSAQRHAYVVLAKSGQNRAAVQVDNIIGNREIVVKSIGPQLARIPGIAGATVMGSGQVILIMNPVQLVFREASLVSVAHTTTTDAQPAATPETNVATVSTSADEKTQILPEGPTLAEAIASSAYDSAGFLTEDVSHVMRANPLVMVVDDSLTVRKITSRMLTRENFEVATAKDGVDGLQQLQDIEPDIILLDIEMPRMDGFEFARNVRADAKTRHIPIIMITSRTADKHRNRALELGVNEYMGKPYQEEQLLALIRQYVKQSQNA